MATILIVDDDKDVITLVGFILEREGHKIFTANDGKEGLELALREKPGLIVMDIMMPEMDGYIATTELSKQPATRDIPVIILTAKGNMRGAFELSPNVASYIEKPFESKHLTNIIHKILSGQK
jgi:CheY-like chemotaxis protein